MQEMDYKLNERNEIINRYVDDFDLVITFTEVLIILELFVKLS